jgi:hypothetical protein
MLRERELCSAFEGAINESRSIIWSTYILLERGNVACRLLQLKTGLQNGEKGDMVQCCQEGVSVSFEGQRSQGQGEGRHQKCAQNCIESEWRSSPS